MNVKILTTYMPESKPCGAPWPVASAWQAGLNGSPWNRGITYEVEFVTLEGRTAAVVTLEAADVRPVSPREIPHARQLAPV